MTKLQDKEDSGRVSDADLHEARCRSDVVTYGLMAEAQHFHQHRISDFRSYVQAYLNAQIEFHRMVCSAFAHIFGPTCIVFGAWSMQLSCICLSAGMFAAVGLAATRYQLIAAWPAHSNKCGECHVVEG